MEFYQKALSLKDYTVGLRRHFHTYPECMPMEQVHTMERIEQELDAAGIPHVRVPEGGIFGFIEGGRPGKTLLLRSDIDALPIRENPLNLASPRTCCSQIDGVMHACGHDAHMAMLLTSARILKEMAPELPGRILLMFEEGEEGGGNIAQLCRYMEKEGLMPDGAYACHVLWNLPSGIIGVTDGVSMCGLNHFAIDIHGQTAHGSRPDQGHNVIDCFTRISAAMQNIRMTAIEPSHQLTYSICTVRAGERHNVLPEELHAEGTIRFEQTEDGARFLAQAQRIAEMCGTMCGCEARLTLVEQHQPVEMEAGCRKLLRSAVQDALGADHLCRAPLWMASETYSYITNMIPSAYAFVGIRNEKLGSGAGHHTEQFDIDEDALPRGVAAEAAYAAAFLQDPPDTSGFRKAAPTMDDYLKMIGL